jgi:6-phosphogluconolactonase
VITTLPEDYVGSNTTAEIQFAPSGHFLYVSNRGHNSIVIFSVDQASGKLRSDRLGADGRPPRVSSVSIRPGACSTRPISTAITSWRFGVNAETGRLTPTGRTVETRESILHHLRPRLKFAARIGQSEIR